MCIINIVHNVYRSTCTGTCVYLVVFFCEYRIDIIHVITQKFDINNGTE